MGVYLNPDNGGFEIVVNTDIYVDKTKLIGYTNSVIRKENRFVCVSRPRRFGKSIAAKMLSAYYSKGCDSSELFGAFKIKKDDSFFKYLNQYDVIFLDIQLLIGRAGGVENLISYINKVVIRELKKEYSQYMQEEEESLSAVLAMIYEQRREKKGFIFVVDEWDCIFREAKDRKNIQKEYLEFLNILWKGQDCIDLVYMTGILPIKKYGTHSALNIFSEFSMTDPDELAEYVGFTEEEVKNLCLNYKKDFQTIKKWYDGYCFEEESHIYNPRSVVEAMRRKRIKNYWVSTETYEALRVYICMNFDGLKDDIVKMLGGISCKVNTRNFQNDMTTFKSKDDVFTLLIHLGYLAYNQERREVFIPNEEIKEEFINAISDGGWENIVELYQESERLLEATYQMENDTVATMIDKAHTKTTSILQHNDENSLSCVITLAYQAAMKNNMIIREFPSGKGYADIVFLPLKHIDKPALIIELKWDKTASRAIRQMKEKRYVEALENYTGEVLMVGINYEKKKGRHECEIEKFEM